MTKKKEPFCYTLIPCGDDGQDLLFKRIRGRTTEASNVWAMHMDIDDLNPENVLIFVQGTVPPEKVHDNILKAHAFFNSRIRPFLPQED